MAQLADASDLNPQGQKPYAGSISPPGTIQGVENTGFPKIEWIVCSVVL
jgi:hypothetical protein